MNHADKNNILYPLQHGFRCKRSCETQHIEFIDEVTTNMSAGKQTDVLIMDFSKAFDKVSHGLLVHKLDHYGIRGKTNTWIQNFLSDRSQAVVVDGEKSSYIDVDSGVRQGSVLGPSLFLFYINDMPCGLKSTVRLFVDDTIAYLAVTSEADSVDLQSDLNKLDECNVLTISQKANPIKFEYELHGQTLKSVNNAKYLGCLITSDLRWTNHINSICGKANKTLGFLHRNLNIGTTKQNAYNSLVRPIVEYASTVWDPYTQKDIHTLEMVQRRGARYICNKHGNRSSVDTMLDTLKWKTL